MALLTCCCRSSLSSPGSIWDPGSRELLSCKKEAVYRGWVEQCVALRSTEIMATVKISVKPAFIARRVLISHTAHATHTPDT
jgi:hypothetical protein